MWNIFEYPWTLLLTAFFIALCISILRSIFQNKYRWWYIAPVLLVIASFGIDFIIQTDLEKINKVVNTGIAAAEEENSDIIATITSDNYHDSHHNTKTDLISYCRVLLSEPLIEKNTRIDSAIEISAPNATATVVVLTLFDEQSFIYEYKPYQLTQVRLTLQKTNDKNWFINRAEILEIDRKTVNWKHIK